MTHRLLVLLCVALSPQLAPAEQALGRLFFTAEQRAALERSRTFKAQQTPQTEAGSLSLEGIVRRSDGSGTAWINGRPHHVADPKQGVAIRLRPDASGATVAVGDEAPAPLNVGETIDRGTGERQSAIAKAQIRAKSVGRP